MGSSSRTTVAVACAEGFLSTLDEFYRSHPDSQHAADHGLDRLERLQPRCVRAAGQAQ